MSKRSAYVVVSVVVAAAGVPAVSVAAAPTPTSKRIVLGKSIGGVAIGQTFTKARAVWGPGGLCPKPAVPAPPGEVARRFCTWIVGEEGELGTASIEGARRVENLDIAVALDARGLPRISPLRALRTAQGIGLGSSSRAVRKAYPRAVRKVIVGFENPYVDYVVRAANGVKTTFEVRGPAQRVAVIRIGY